MAQKKQLKSTIKSDPLRDRVIHVRMSEEEFAKIVSKSQRWAGGNLSAWVRYAAMTCNPKSGDVVAISADEMD
jgi:hypothetical protein